jgi:hypothetical protein
MFNTKVCFILSVCILTSASTTSRANNARLEEQIAKLTQTIQTLSSKISLLQNYAPITMDNKPSFFSIRSLNDFGSWTWQNKGNITLAGCGLTFVYVLHNACREGTKTRRLIMRLFQKLKEMHQEAVVQRQTLLDGINDLRNQQNLPPLQFNQQQDHELQNPDDSWTTWTWNNICTIGRNTASGWNTAYTWMSS